MNSISEYRERAYRILEGREHSAQELRQKLLRKGCPQEIVEKLLEEFISLHLIDDRRFGEMLVRSKLRQGWGQRRIYMELQRCGIGKEDLDAILSRFERELSADEEYAQVKQIAERRLRSTADVNKVFRYLVNRGHEISCISRVLRELSSRDDSDEMFS